MRVLVLSNIGLGLYKFRKELLEELVRENEVYFCTPEDECPFWRMYGTKYLYFLEYENSLSGISHFENIVTLIKG